MIFNTYNIEYPQVTSLFDYYQPHQVNTSMVKWQLSQKANFNKLNARNDKTGWTFRKTQ